MQLTRTPAGGREVFRGTWGGHASKSKTNIISDGERVRLNGTGNPGMAVGGTGDVLAGITGAFYCRNGAFEAAASAAFVGGAAGDMAYEDKGFWMTATDMIGQVPYVMKKYRLR
jgi:NAD(P)H-hydrate epimerase